MGKDTEILDCDKEFTLCYETGKESESAKAALRRELGLADIIGKSRAIEELREKIERISLCDVTILISGESGTGKELAARAVHYLSKRAARAFLPVNCGAIPENLYENELFGHAKGAFTGAALRQTGLIKEAEGGTLFFDEIDTVSQYAQIKFLRLLQEKEYKPLGESRPHKADIRIIAATNKDLFSLVREGAFREDLYYRLNIISLRMPPLRERGEDIPVLVDHFVKKYSSLYKMPALEISRDAMEVFVSYNWPGNVRELENKIQHLLVMSSDPVITAKKLRLDPCQQICKEPEPEPLKLAKTKAISAFEKKYLILLLSEYNGNVINAAKRAGKSRTAFWNLLKRHSLSPKSFKQA